MKRFSSAFRFALPVFLLVGILFVNTSKTFAVTPNWNTTSTYVVAFNYLGTDYPHDMSLVQDGLGNLTGNGGSPTGSNVYTWVIDSGTVSGDNINFTAHYTATADAVTPLTTMNVTGTIAGGSISGTWSDNYQGGSRSGTLTTTSGNAVAIPPVPPAPVTPPCSAGSSFDTTSTTGSVNGQDGWSVTNPSYDQAVVNNTYGYSTFGCKALRISNAFTSSSFTDQTFSPSNANEAGETLAVSSGFSGGTRQNHYEAQFDIASTSSVQQPGLVLSVSPDRGDGARMSYLRFEDQADGMHVFFDDYSQGDFNESDIATLTRSPHTIKFAMDFVDGAANDVVKIYIDGNLVHTGTSWEDYYRFDPEQAGNGNQVPTVDSLLFRVGGAAAPANAGNGFLIDNFNLSSSASVAPTVVYVDDSYSSVIGISTPDGHTVGVDAFTTITAGVNAVATGGIVNVAAGTYTEHVVISKSIVLKGANFLIPGNGARGAESIVDGDGTDATFAVKSDFVTIDGFTIKGGQNGLNAGIWAETGHTNLRFRNSIITDNAIGIYARCAGSCNIVNNLFDGNNRPGASGGTAIYSDTTTTGLTVSGNEFKNHSTNSTIVFGAAAGTSHNNLKVLNNNFHDNTAIASVIYALSINGGTFSGNTISATSGVTALSFSGNDTNITVTGNTITTDTRGVRVDDQGYGFGPNSNIVVNKNSITGISVGVGNYALGLTDVNYVGSLDATANFWGSTNPTFTDIVSGDVDFTPWCLDASCTILVPPFPVLPPSGGAGLGSGGGGGASQVLGAQTGPTTPSTPTGNSGEGQVLGAETGPTVIAGCDNATVGFSTVTGESCANNLVTGGEGAAKFHFTLTLKLGSHGNEVMELQKFLSALGFDITKIDGKFGKETKSALVKFQSANGLRADGVVGVKTRVYLNR